MNRQEYIAESLSESAEEHGALLTSEQVTQISTDIENSLDCWRMYSGLEVADANWTANNRREMIEKGRKEILDLVADLISDLDRGSNVCFDYMSHEQKLAMGKLSCLEDHARRTLKRAA